MGSPAARTTSDARNKAFVGLLALVFALVEWYPFGALSVLAVGMGSGRLGSNGATTPDGHEPWGCSPRASAPSRSG
jgi:hypothetical protein